LEEQPTAQRAIPNDCGERIDASFADRRILGTPLYLSPEALAGRDPDPSFDLWSICLVLFEAMAGRNPAQDDSPVKSLLRIETCSFPDLRSFVPNADAELTSFFRHALSANPLDRPRSAQVLREQLSALAASEHVPRGAT